MPRPFTTAAVAALVLLQTGTAWAQESPSPRPQDCNKGGGVFISAPAPRSVVAGDLVTVTLTARGFVDNAYVNFSNSYRWANPAEKGEVQWTAPHPDDAVREITPLADGQAATATVTLRPTTNTRVRFRFGYRTGCLFADGMSIPPDEVVDVAPRLTLTAVRNGPRDYTFSGVASRAGQLLNLYRVTASGSEVLTSQTRAGSTGTWERRRIFLGSGRFGFVVRTGRDMANAPGASSIRDTVIH